MRLEKHRSSDNDDDDSDPGIALHTCANDYIGLFAVAVYDQLVSRLFKLQCQLFCANCRRYVNGRGDGSQNELS